MKKIIEKRNYIILIIIIVLLFWIFNNKNKTFVESFDLNDKVLTVIIYEKIDDKKVINKIEKICDKWEKSKKKVNYLNSYAVKELIDYFNKTGIKKYLINEDGNISAGKRYKNDKYSVSILNPKNGDILRIVKLENESMVTVKDDNNSVSVIYKDNAEAFRICTELFNLGVDEGKKICGELKCEAFWYIDGKVYETKNK